MSWIGVALLAHFINAIVFTADKSLLSSGHSVVGNPAKYAALSGLVAAGAAIILPLGFALPNEFVLVWSLLAGVCWVAALWLFFRALKEGESSRVVPIAGSAVPVFTLIIATLFLGEALTTQQLWAVGALIAGGVLLTIRFTGTTQLSPRVLVSATGSGLMFAMYFVIIDYIYAHFGPFISAFAYSRLGVGIVALFLFIHVSITNPARQASHPSFVRRGKRRLSLTKAGIVLGAAFVGSKVLASLALMLQSYAINLGNVTVVNALQGTQYAFVLLFALMISRRFPNLFREEVGRVALGQKLFGIAVIGVGLVLLV
jgi:drug/metabolite transporter (DMT)-like permease